MGIVVLGAGGNEVTSVQRPVIDLGTPVAIVAVVLFGLVSLPIAFLEGRKHAPVVPVVSQFRLDGPSVFVELEEMKADCGDCWKTHPIPADMIANVPAEALLTSAVQYANFFMIEVQYPDGRLTVRAYKWDGTTWLYFGEWDERLTTP